MTNWRRFGLFMLAASAVAGLLTWGFFASPRGAALISALNGRSPNEWVRYAQKRLQGHDKLEFFLLPPLMAFQGRLERPPPPGPLPDLGKGQQPHTLDQAPRNTDKLVSVSSPQEIRAAMLNAEPGTWIQIKPGLYPFSEKLRLGHDGQPSAPIVLGTSQPGTVWLEFDEQEGFLVNRPYWVFENLNIRGACARQDDCEHAFHVVGKAAFTTLRNNRIQDFNAHIKVNGEGEDWPDHGLIAFNTLTNSSPRKTARSVVPFDLVGASHWRVQDNLVSHFVKSDGNQVSFGMFMKGAGEGGRFERNLVICSQDNVSSPGVRVGISFGGGGTDPQACRIEGCRAYEHRQGLAANNIVAHCNDTGLDVNHSRQIVLAHNTLINTSGIAARRSPAGALLYGNLYEGLVLARDGAQIDSEHDLRIVGDKTFWLPDALDFRWRIDPASIPATKFVTNDFYLRPRTSLTTPGATGADSPPGALRPAIR